MVNGRGVFPSLLLSVLFLTSVACDRQEGEITESWPLSCQYASFESKKLNRCAMRDARGQLVVRPDLLADIATGSPVQSMFSDGEWLFAVNGKSVPALAYDNGADYFKQGLARTVRNGKIGFVNTNLDVVVKPVWDFAFPFENGFALVCTGCGKVIDGEHTSIEGGSWGYIDTGGKIVVEPVYTRDTLPLP